MTCVVTAVGDTCICTCLFGKQKREEESDVGEGREEGGEEERKEKAEGRERRKKG